MRWKTNTLTVSNMKINILAFMEQEATMLRSCTLPFQLSYYTEIYHS